MNLISVTIFLSLTIALISIIYTKKFFLSILLCLESILLIITAYNFLLFFMNNNNYTGCFSLFIITLSAVEASIGISLLTLVTRNFSNNKIANLNTLII